MDPIGGNYTTRKDCNEIYWPWPQLLAVLSLPQMQQRAREIRYHEYQWAIALLFISCWLTMAVSVPLLILLSLGQGNKQDRTTYLGLWDLFFCSGLTGFQFLFFFRVDPCLLSILNIAVVACQSQTLNLSLLPTHLSW